MAFGTGLIVALAGVTVATVRADQIRTAGNQGVGQPSLQIEQPQGMRLDRSHTDSGADTVRRNSSELSVAGTRGSSVPKTARVGRRSAASAGAGA